MHYWNTKKLAAEIKAGVLSETDRKNYYIGSSVITVIAMNMAIIAGAENKYYAIATAVLSLFIIVFGINLTFKANGGNEGRDYIARVLILSFPLFIKIYVLAVLASIVLMVPVYMISGNNPMVVEWISLLISVAIQIIYFWRLNVHLKEINI
jgi:hypothetical protein